MVCARRILLVHPPFGDYTQPYHALSYVAPPLRAAGFEVDVLDLNALWFRSLLRRETMERWRGEWDEELGRLERLSRWSIAEQERAFDLLQGVALSGTVEPGEAVATLRGEGFYDDEQYLRARSEVRAVERLATLRYRPYDFFSAFAVPVYVPSARRLVDAGRGCERLVSELAKLLDRHGASDYLVCGVSVPFTMHLMGAVATLEAIGRVWPSARRVAGGTAISDVVRYAASAEALKPFAEVCDDLYVGEAELGVAQYAGWCAGETVALPEQVVSLHADQLRPSGGPMRYVSLGGASRRFQAYDWKRHPPTYDWIDWSLYLSPERQVNYSPSRGCFWNRCTFCDYGLNDGMPAAPSRTMDAALVADHMERLIGSGVRHVYFAVDALAPSFLDSFADQVVRRGLVLNWSAELMLTEQFTPELIAKLERSGMVTASFGLESGSERVLERMGKGERRVSGVLRPVLERFRRSKIGLQPKYFFGFPGETDEDREATLALLTKFEDVLAVRTRGNVFDLSMHSMVAREPAAFGISRVERREGDDIGGGLTYELSSGEPTPGPASFAEFNARIPQCRAHERPWAGGIDTLHTKLYLERFGRDVFHRLRPRQSQSLWLSRWASITRSSRFDLHEAADNVLIDRAARSAFASARLEQRLGPAVVQEAVAAARAGMSAGDKAEYELQLSWSERDDLGEPAGVSAAERSCA